MEEQCPAGGAERQVAKLVEDDEIGVGEPRRDLSGFALKLFLLEGVDEFEWRRTGRACDGARSLGRRSRWRDASSPCRSRQRHGAGILASEETVYYAFHPLAGRTVASTGRRVVYGGEAHLTIRLADGTLTLTPEWMLRPAAAGYEVRSALRLSLARLRDLRVYLDAVLGSDQGDLVPDRRSGTCV